MLRPAIPRKVWIFRLRAAWHAPRIYLRPSQRVGACQVGGHQRSMFTSRFNGKPCHSCCSEEPSGLSLLTKASPPAQTSPMGSLVATVVQPVRKALGVVGKSGDSVWPVTYALPTESTAI